MEKDLEKFLDELSEYEREMFMAKLYFMCDYYSDHYISINDLSFEKIVEDIKKLDKYPNP